MSQCTRCGAAFTCAMADQTGQPCWCASLPPLLAVPDADGAAGCWCPDCLKKELAGRSAAAGSQPATS